MDETGKAEVSNRGIGGRLGGARVWRWKEVKAVA